MSKTVKVLLIIVTVLVVGALAYIFSLKNIGTCVYNGKSYHNGSSFKSIDGCNSCGCGNGKVACTMMFCADGIR